MKKINTPEYTEGICGDGAAILKDGQPMTITEILETLRSGTKAIEERDTLTRIINNAFSALSMYGVTRERAGKLDNGIMVLMTRIQKEKHCMERHISDLTEERDRLRKALEKANDTLQYYSISYDGETGLLRNLDKKSDYEIRMRHMCDTAMKALFEIKGEETE